MPPVFVHIALSPDTATVHRLLHYASPSASPSSPCRAAPHHRLLQGDCGDGSSITTVPGFACVWSVGPNITRVVLKELREGEVAGPRTQSSWLGAQASHNQSFGGTWKRQLLYHQLPIVRLLPIVDRWRIFQDGKLLHPSFVKFSSSLY